MDTLELKVDMGVLKIDDLGQAKADNVFIEVGFGNLFLDLSKEALQSSHIYANVGAGSMDVTISNSKTPIIIHMSNTLFCKFKMKEKLRKIKKNTYVTDAYSPDDPNLITFDLDVALGNIQFKVVE